MGKRQLRQDKSRAGRSFDDDLLPFSVPKRKVLELTGRNDAQKAYMRSIGVNTVTFGIGPAGTGKTYLSAWIAADLLDKKKIERVIVTRPAVEAGEELGFLPGEMDDKVAPYFAPVLEALQKRLGASSVAYLRKAEAIMFVPLAYMRGRTFDDAFVLADEMQNSTPAQMKMFLTRIGDRTKYVVNGDLKQSDIIGPNGLDDAINRFQDTPDIGVSQFTAADVVRSGMAQVMVEGYEGVGATRLPSFACAA